MGEIRVGISGWTYAGWRGDFYPQGLVQKRELAYAAERLGSVEINGSFYSLQRPTSYARWRAETPDDFVFAVKGGRFITHMKRLRDVETPLANFLASGVLALGPKLGPLLWQLPETLAYDEAVARDFFAMLPRTHREVAAIARGHDAKVPEDRALTVAEEAELDRPVRHALEFRSETWCTDAAFDLMREHDVGCVVADTARRFPMAEAVTSDLVYVRLHGDTELYTSGYGDAALRRWADKCRAWAEDGGTEQVVVYFDNDAKGFAPHDAMALQDLLRSRGSTSDGGA
ncbi:DUF72 domain-containing protein [Nocardioides dongkuii]|uniref:DUF72 domain-containing protein n=1 Tax=Nocardioides dongkuii TaxID=2760089 RepID=UPI001877B5E1|nr:DUF72 domain-containing protein [Nocardioides dongkuii]